MTAVGVNLTDNWVWGGVPATLSRDPLERCRLHATW